MFNSLLQLIGPFSETINGTLGHTTILGVDDDRPSSGKVVRSFFPGVVVVLGRGFSRLIPTRAVQRDEFCASG